MINKTKSGEFPYFIYIGDNFENDLWYKFFRTPHLKQVRDNYSIKFFHTTDTSCAEYFGAEKTPVVVLKQAFDREEKINLLYDTIFG